MSVPEDFGHWLAGFIDGEGCFQINTRNYLKFPGRPSVFTVKFAINVREDDAPILKEIQAVTGLGGIFYSRRGRGTSNPLVSWQVSSKAELLRLVEILDRFPLRAKKAREYPIWRKAVFLYAQIRSGPVRADWQPIAVLQKRLRETRAYFGELEAA